MIDDVKFGPKNIGMDSLKIDMNSFQALKQVGIGEDLLDVSPLELSGGQKTPCSHRRCSGNGAGGVDFR